MTRGSFCAALACAIAALWIMVGQQLAVDADGHAAIRELTSARRAIVLIIDRSGAESRSRSECSTARTNSHSARIEFHAASTMKVPVMIELFRQARIGSLEARRPGAGHKRISQHRRREYIQARGRRRFRCRCLTHVGGQLSYRQLCESMITTSSNLAANILIEHLGAKEFRRQPMRLERAACTCCAASKTRKHSRRA